MKYLTRKFIFFFFLIIQGSLKNVCLSIVSSRVLNSTFFYTQLVSSFVPEKDSYYTFSSLVQF